MFPKFPKNNLGSSNLDFILKHTHFLYHNHKVHYGTITHQKFCMAKFEGDINSYNKHSTKAQISSYFSCLLYHKWNKNASLPLFMKESVTNAIKLYNKKLRPCNKTENFFIWFSVNLNMTEALKCQNIYPKENLYPNRKT